MYISVDSDPGIVLAFVVFYLVEKFQSLFGPKLADVKGGVLQCFSLIDPRRMF